MAFRIGRSIHDVLLGYLISIIGYVCVCVCACVCMCLEGSVVG